MRPYIGIGAWKLYEAVYQITFSVTNTSGMDGSKVPQLHLGFSREAEGLPKVLRGFERVYLARGESKQVSLVNVSEKKVVYDATSDV